ncbi:leucine-rich repeat-containing protein 9 [Hippocampus comes]|uniref:leucine-rich repeat-containing protein 9 n=1 Tax=Hippocampus comes TaxID=109280 RepID=UPI00094E371F|nr:PREDICTED: leucine-rich repeat-containing protein 9-like [Hippocampus comes]XP_019725756.1 PREDICTED: leucine-rich repeat-containing protein 9-like [Hippocampus comes]
MQSTQKGAVRHYEKPYCDEEVVRELCMANGLSYDDLAEEVSNVTSLEIILSGFPRMVGLSFFPMLRQLQILGQDIKRIEGLESCPLLQELWVVECKLTKISGLQHCPDLKKLYLYDNKITEIKNLKFLVNIEVLWLNNNYISQIQGLNALQNLQELNLANNNIHKIGDSLVDNVNLHTLNLSGNKISSFNELTWLTCLSQLRDLALSDFTSTPNPLCLLCNYATHVMFHLPLLLFLDTYDVSSTQINEVAESAVMKKMMFYNMRVRIPRRNLKETLLRLLKKKNASLESPKESIRSLNYTLKNLERWLCKKSFDDHPKEDLSTKGDSCDPSAEQILRKIEVLQQRLAIWTRRLHDIESWHQHNVSQATETMEDSVHFMSTELQSVGNIRMEEGSSTDPWFTSCCDLLLSRFSLSDFMSHGITGIKINRVVRIHNSGLRLRFKDKLQSLLAREDSVTLAQNYKQQLEHLFYVGDSDQNREDVLSILEEGFKSAKEYKALGKEAAVPLSNSLIVSEQPRIEYLLRRAEQGCYNIRTDKIPFRSGRVIVSKVFLGHSVPIKEGELVNRRVYPRAASVYRSVHTKHRDGLHTTIPKGRKWFVFDNELVLPEYMICFEYLTGGSEQPTSLDDCMHVLDPPTYDTSLDKQAVNMEPVLEPQPKLGNLNETVLLNVSGASLLRDITVLNLHNNGLSSLKGIPPLPALRHLTLSFNELTSLNHFAHMPNLEFLDVSFNQLVSLEGLQELKQLTHLDLSWNQLTNAGDVSTVLKIHTPALQILETQHNPWNKPEDVRTTILSSVMKLRKLDNTLVAEEEVANAVHKTTRTVLTQEILIACSHTNDERPRSLSLVSTTQLLSELIPPPRDLSPDLQPDWASKITSLNLDNQKICQMSHLDALVNLRWASFNNNYISEVEGLDFCTNLEELSLNNNNISTLSGLSHLQNLSKLSMDGNQLSNFDAIVLDQLHSLTFLSVENNLITSLHGIHRCSALLELYAGNNHISVSRDIYYLKVLENLIILDLYGNPLAENLKNYRIYVVFHLPNLKALDGCAVDAAECENAKAMFGGRLTPDLVAEKLGHSHYSSITYLTVNSCSIRSVDLSPIDLFFNVHTINLDHNNLTCFSGLIHLPNVKVLCLSYNRIESILPRQKTFLTNRQMLHNKVHSSGYGQQSLCKGSRHLTPTIILEPLMSSLEVLHLSHNGISNMANLELSRLTNLKTLFLQGNEISQVEGLEGLHQLKELVLDRNRIRALYENSFVSQNALLELHLTENRIRELNHLYPLIELRKLYLGMNKLQDISELDKLDVLPALTELSVVGNPVARNSLHRPAVMRSLSQLQVLDGMTVTMEERTRAEITDATQCEECCAASALEANQPGLMTYMPVKGMSMTGLQSLIHGHDMLPSNKDEPQVQYTSKNKKSTEKNPSSSQGDVSSRQARKARTNLIATCPLPQGK